MNKEKLPRLSSLAADETDLVCYEQLIVLYKQALLAVLASLIVALMLIFMLWGVVDALWLMIWGTCIALALSVRSISSLQFFRLKPCLSANKKWKNIHMSVTLLVSVVWACAGMLLFVIPDDAYVYQAALVMMLLGVASGAVITLSAMLKSVVIFLIFIFTPVGIFFLLQGSTVSLLIGIACVIYFTFLLIGAYQNYKIHLQNITLRIRSEQREAAMMVSEQSALQTSVILERIAQGGKAREIYAAIAMLYEAKNPELRCGILEIKGQHWFTSESLSLPEEFCRLLQRLYVGEDEESYGHVALHAERVLVADISTDPKWAEIKDMALLHGLHSAWSEPVHDGEGKVMGVFCMYQNKPGLPNAAMLADLQAAAHLAGVVMARNQREVSLRILSEAIAQAGESILISDVNGVVEYVNPSFTKLTGYTPEDIIGNTPRVLKSGLQDAMFYENLWKTITAGKIWSKAIVDQRKDGSQFPALMSIAPIVDEVGKITHYVSIQQDMTEHQALEHQFHQAQKMEALGILVGGIAHDFNNILAGMTGNLYLAKKLSAEHPDMHHKLSNVEHLAFRAADLIRQLLTFARSDMVSMKPLPLTTFIKEPLKLLHTSIPENITLRHEICGESLLINGDHNQLYQVLVNLVNNARDALDNIEKPVITVRLSPFTTSDTFLETHQYFKPGCYAHLQVQDNGCGIAAANIEHVFEPFFTTKEQGKGTGLGLAMVFGAVKMHQGYIEVESEEGVGCTFHIYISLLGQDAHVDVIVPH